MVIQIYTQPHEHSGRLTGTVEDVLIRLGWGSGTGLKRQGDNKSCIEK